METTYDNNVHERTQVWTSTRFPEPPWGLLIVAPLWHPSEFASLCLLEKIQLQNGVSCWLTLGSPFDLFAIDFLLVVLAHHITPYIRRVLWFKMPSTTVSPIAGGSLDLLSRMNNRPWKANRSLERERDDPTTRERNPPNGYPISETTIDLNIQTQNQKEGASAMQRRDPHLVALAKPVMVTIPKQLLPSLLRSSINGIVAMIGK